MNPKTTVIRLDANRAVGIGHAVRTSAVVNLLKQNWRVVVVGNGKVLRDFFDDVEVIEISMGDEQAFQAIVQDLDPQLVIVDHARADETVWESANAGTNAKVVAIDDPGGDIHADLVVNGTILREFHHYSGLKPGARILAGGDYAMLRPEFCQSRWERPDHDAVTMVVGSGELAADWLFMLLSDQLNRDQWGALTVVVGNAFAQMDELRKACESVGADLRQGCSSHDLVRLLVGSSVALVTGGMVLYEVVALGVPAIVFPQVGMEEAQWFADRGCVINLGRENGFDSGCIEKSVHKLLVDGKFARDMSHKQLNTLDGYGAFRVAEAIEQLVSHSPNEA